MSTQKNPRESTSSFRGDSILEREIEQQQRSLNDARESMKDLAASCVVDDSPTFRLDIRPGAFRGIASSHRVVPSGFCHVKYTVLATGEEVDELRPQCPRGKVSEFSSKARNRLLLTLFSFLEFPSLFLTLTFPGEWSDFQDSRTWKKIFERFRRRLERAYPLLYAVWKLEPQKRGAPHWHLLCWSSFSVLERAKFYVWCSRAWADCVAHGDHDRYIDHLQHGVDCEWMTGAGKIRSYVAKYVGKCVMGRNARLWDSPGRWWGEVGKVNKPIQSRLSVDLSVSDYYMVRRLIRRWAKSKKVRATGKTPAYARRITRHSSYFCLCDDSVVLNIVEHVTGFPVCANLLHLWHGLGSSSAVLLSRGLVLPEPVDCPFAV